MFVKNKVWEKLQVAIIDDIKIFIHRGNWSNLKNLLMKDFLLRKYMDK